ncbi:MAG: BMP family ABC transporter substrate-binding protein [Eubacterium sp.]|nr:BMP family ABC transporter substrate-binding protein [Eubacterium sp.]
MKKYLALLLALTMVFTMTGCGRKSAESNTSAEAATHEKVDDDRLKVGFILPAEDGAPDTEARITAIRKMQNKTGLTDSQVFIQRNVGKEQCPEEINALVKKGCQLIFALGARYEEPVLEAAAENKDIWFCLEGGRESIKSELPNLHTFNSRIYEAYYAAGCLAGMEINHRLNNGNMSPYDCRVGFVAYKDCAETNTCINAFYLGIRTACSQSTIDVRYVGKRGNYDADGEAARQLAASGVGMMCTYTYTSAAAAVCAERGIPVVGNENNIIDTAPKRAITSTYTDWSYYYIEAVEAMIGGKALDKDFCGGYKGGMVYLTQLNDAEVVNGTAERLMEVEKNLRQGKVQIFKTDSFTIDGQSLETLIQNNGDFKKKYAKYVKKGQLKEQSIMSAPIFKDRIDGVHVSTQNYLDNSDGDSDDQ